MVGTPSLVRKLLQPRVALPQLRAVAPDSARQVSAVANEGTSHDPESDYYCAKFWQVGCW